MSPKLESFCELLEPDCLYFYISNSKEILLCKFNLVVKKFSVCEPCSQWQDLQPDSSTCISLAGKIAKCSLLRHYFSVVYFSGHLIILLPLFMQDPWVGSLSSLCQSTAGEAWLYICGASVLEI